jgi:sugar phosphate isomerase/epimerase
MEFFLSSNVLSEMPLKKAIQVFVDQGAAGIEIWVEHLWFEETPIGELRTLMNRLNLKRTLHAPSRDINLTSSNPGIREESLKQTMEALDIAARLDVSMVTVHPGHLSSTKDIKTDYEPLQLIMFEKIGRRARELGIHVGIEIMEKKPRETIIEPEDLSTLFETLENDYIGSTVDIAHAATHWKDPFVAESLTENILGYIRRAKRMFHVHLSNFDETRVHLPLKRGKFDCLPIIQELNKTFRGVIAVEGFVPGEGMSVLTEDIQVIREWNTVLRERR